MQKVVHHDKATPFAIRRLSALARLSNEDFVWLEEAARRRQRILPKCDVVEAGAATRAALLMLEGWAYRSCMTPDGRRQIIQFLLPGDVIPALPEGLTQHISVTAFTHIAVCALPDPASLPECDGLMKAVAMSATLDTRYLYRQIARLGRLDALERVVDWLLEIRERQKLPDDFHDNTFPMPLTQETIADTLGLTAVHVNRTLQALRRADLVQIGRGTATLIDPEQCELLVGHRR